MQGLGFEFMSDGVQSAAFRLATQPPKDTQGLGWRAELSSFSLFILGSVLLTLGFSLLRW